jgi:hypothetical protein
MFLYFFIFFTGADEHSNGLEIPLTVHFQCLIFVLEGGREEGRERGGKGGREGWWCGRQGERHREQKRKKPLVNLFLFLFYLILISCQIISHNKKVTKE